MREKHNISTTCNNANAMQAASSANRQAGRQAVSQSVGYHEILLVLRHLVVFDVFSTTRQNVRYPTIPYNILLG